MRVKRLKIARTVVPETRTVGTLYTEKTINV